MKRCNYDFTGSSPSDFIISRSDIEDESLKKLENYNSNEKYIILDMTQDSMSTAVGDDDLIKVLCEFPEFPLCHTAIVTNIGLVALVDSENNILAVYDLLTEDTDFDGNVIPTILADERSSLAKLTVIDDPLHFRRLRVKNDENDTFAYFEPEIKVQYDGIEFSALNIDFIVSSFEINNENDESADSSEETEVIDFSSNSVSSFSLITPSTRLTFESFYEDIEYITRVAIDFKPHLLVRSSNAALTEIINVYLIEVEESNMQYYQLTPYKSEDTDLYFDMTNFQLYMVYTKDSDTKWYLVVELDGKILTDEEFIEVL